MRFIASLVGFIAAASAVTINYPARDSSARPNAYNNGTITITWSSVSTDPNSVDVLLSTNNGQSTQTIARNVNTSDDSYTVDLAGVAPGSNYAVNLAPASSTSQTGILAQSGTFNVLQGAVSSSASASAPSTASTSSSKAASATRVASTVSTEVSSATTTASSTATESGAASSGAAVPIVSGNSTVPISTSSANTLQFSAISAVLGGALAVLYL